MITKKVDHKQELISLLQWPLLEGKFSKETGCLSYRVRSREKNVRLLNTKQIATWISYEDPLLKPPYQ